MYIATAASLKPKKRKRAWNLFFLALPLIVVVFLFSYVPLLGWFLALFEYKPGYALWDCEFVGLKYFQILITNANTARVLKNTVIFSLLGFLCLPLPMLLAILLNEINHPLFRKASQVITTLPHFISWVIVYSVFFSIFSREGMLNQLLSMMGMKNQSLLTDRNAVYWFQTLITQWKSVGWSSIIYIAAVAGIDQELYEAAYVDGAGRLRCALSITLPSLLPTFTVMMLLNISNFVNTGMDQYYQFKNNIIYNKIEVLDLFVYRLGLQQGDYSYAIAVGILKSIISITLLFIANATARKVRGNSIV
jgi:putative aldouronate transport system permease protein